MYFGADYYPEHWPREIWEKHAVLMREANFTVVRLGDFSWSMLEPEQGKYDFDWLDDANRSSGGKGYFNSPLHTYSRASKMACRQIPEYLYERFLGEGKGIRHKVPLL